MDVRNLASFRAVAEHASFSVAAERLNYAQSTVTAQVQNLERELDVRLFDRIGRTVRLTPAGRSLLGYAVRIDDLIRSAVEEVRGRELAPRVLRIGTAESLCTYRLPPVIQRFRREYPEVRLAVEVAECRAVREGVLEGRYDLGLFIDEPDAGEGIEFVDLGPEPVVLVAEPGHRLAGRARIAPRELVNETAIVLETTCSYRRLFEALLQRAGTRQAPILEFNSIEAAKQCAASGIGIAVLPRFTVEAELRDGRLAELPASLHARLRRQLAYRSAEVLPRALGDLIETIVEELRGT